MARTRNRTPWVLLELSDEGWRFHLYDTSGRKTTTSRSYGRRRADMVKALEKSTGRWLGEAEHRDSLLTNQDPRGVHSWPVVVSVTTTRENADA